jgi:hypothetical protein
MARAIRWLAALVWFTGCASGRLESEDPGDEGGACQSVSPRFRDEVWPQVVQRCSVCHVAGGAAAGTRLQLKRPEVPNALAYNEAAFARAAELMSDGEPLLLLKPTRSIPHGGGEVVPRDSAAFAVLEEAVRNPTRPAPCDTGAAPIEEGVALLDPYATLRKATLQLAGRLPTTSEIAAVDAGGLDALGPVIEAQLLEPGFHDRVREIFNDVLLTSAFDSGNGDAQLISGDQVDWKLFPYAERFQSAALYSSCTPGSAGCKRPTVRELVQTEDALAREPVEFFVYAIKHNLPLSTAVTADFRLVNAYTARLFGLPWKGAPPGSYDPDALDAREFLPTRLPGVNEVGALGEYAGLLTTPAWRLRYPNTCTNNNRKIARYTYKHLLNFDVMKSLPRLDLSNLDLSAHPSRTNAQCTGCHTAIDPVAGAYQNYTPCHSAPHRYYPPSERSNCGSGGWFSDAQMFPTGVAAGADAALAPSELPRALELLGAHIAKSEGFDEAMVRHLFTGITGRPPLEPPADPTAEGFAAADAAFNAQQAFLAEGVATFRAHGQRVPQLIVQLVKSPFFRAANAEVGGRMELAALGSGVWTPPERIDAKLTALLGTSWEELFQEAHTDSSSNPARGYGMLTRRDRARIFYGGIDSRTVLTRQRLPSGLAAATSERMALELACLHTARDFLRPAAQRRIFTGVEASESSEAAVLAQLQRMHELFWGVRMTAEDPELLASLALWKAARAAAAGVALPKVCSGAFNLRTGQPEGQPLSAAHAQSLHAWQAVLVYLITDFQFLFE